MKLLELPVLGPDPPHRTGDRAHHHGFGFDHILADPHAIEECAVGPPRRGEEAIPLYHIADLVFLARIFDAHFLGAFALFFGVEHEPTLHLTTDAAQRRRGQYAFG